METFYRQREVTQYLKAALRDFPVVVLTGPRQTGKSTLIRQDADLQTFEYRNLDELEPARWAERDPEGFLQSDRPLAIDEVQRVPTLLRTIKVEVDRNRHPGRFLLSGSANLALMEQVSESLAGRAAYVQLLPMSRREIQGRVAERPVVVGCLEGDPAALTANRISLVADDEILKGGMPSVALGQVRDSLAWFLAYEQTYVERDVRQLSRIGDLVSFRNFVQLTALRTAQVISQSDLARDASLSPATAGRYLSLLEATCLIHRLPAYLRNRTSRLVKNAKVHFQDSGLAGYLAGIRSPEELRGDDLRGALFESYVVSNLLATLGPWQPDARLHHWSIQGRHEVDLVIEAGRRVLAVEIKSGSAIDERAIRGLRAFLQGAPDGSRGIVAYNGANVVEIDESITAVPIAVFLG